MAGPTAHRFIQTIRTGWPSLSIRTRLNNLPAGQPGLIRIDNSGTGRRAISIDIVVTDGVVAEKEVEKARSFIESVDDKLSLTAKEQWYDLMKMATPGSADLSGLLKQSFDLDAEGEPDGSQVILNKSGTHLGVVPPNANLYDAETEILTAVAGELAAELALMPKPSASLPQNDQRVVAVERMTSSDNETVVRNVSSDAATVAKARAATKNRIRELDAALTDRMVGNGTVADTRIPEDDLASIVKGKGLVFQTFDTVRGGRGYLITDPDPRLATQDGLPYVIATGKLEKRFNGSYVLNQKERHALAGQLGMRYAENDDRPFQEELTETLGKIGEGEPEPPPEDPNGR
jgi:hypothetical protein